MDGHFVPNITIGPLVAKALKRVTRTPLDVHLMITDPGRYTEAFREGCPGAVDDFRARRSAAAPAPDDRRDEASRREGRRRAQSGHAGRGALEEVAGDVDFVLVMSVNPGFGGQAFIPRSETKVREIRALLDRAGNREAPIEIDGGIDLTTAPRVVAAGARILVAGSAIFHSGDPERATRELKATAEAALPASSPAAR